jgi:hypothetical protein
MRGAALPVIIVREMSSPATNDEDPDETREAEVGCRAGPVVLAVSGDPVVGRALVLLLRGCRYDARFLPASSLGEPGSLEGVQLLLVTPVPGLSAERREAFSASLRDATRIAEMPVLELVLSSGGAPRGGARAESERAVPWPCRGEELERRIEAALLGNVVRDGPSHQVVGTSLNSGLGTRAVRAWPDPSKAPGNDMARSPTVRRYTGEGGTAGVVDIREPAGVEMESRDRDREQG